MLLIGSVFQNRNCPWLPLQKRFIEATTSVPFELVPIFSDEIKERKHEHLDGLHKLRQIFLQSSYENQFMFLDSDAFPIRKEWYSLLHQRMTNDEIAICCRPENLETRLHCSIMFCKTWAALSRLNFKLCEAQDVMGEREHDICVSPYQEWREQCFPLLRSNRVNIHPVMCGTYFNVFYHHSTGSRPYEMRSKHYWGHCTPVDTDSKALTEALFADPSGFIRPMVWEKGEFPTLL